MENYIIYTIYFEILNDCLFRVWAITAFGLPHGDEGGAVSAAQVLGSESHMGVLILSRITTLPESSTRSYIRVYD